MARRCVTDSSPGLCCAAMAIGVRSGQPFTHPDARTGRERCHVCTIIQKKKGGKGFQHRFAKDDQCSIVSGCPALRTTGGGGGILSLPQGGAVPSV